jgi:Arc/MetJ family transcription regulator
VFEGAPKVHLRVHIDPKLLAEAKALSGHQTTKAVVTEALELIVKLRGGGAELRAERERPRAAGADDDGGREPEEGGG